MSQGSQRPSLWRRLKKKLTNPGNHVVDHKELPSPKWLVIGLGNPGSRYAGTRHNAGIMALETQKMHWQSDKESQAELSWSFAHNDPVVFIHSRKYMNESGLSLGPLVRRWNIPADHIIVLHDELDLPLGKVRIKQGGSHNGHNGLKSIDAALGSNAYVRVRIGIGRPTAGKSVVEHVLGALPHTEQCDTGIKNAWEAVVITISQGLAKAQNLIHGRK